MTKKTPQTHFPSLHRGTSPHRTSATHQKPSTARYHLFFLDLLCPGPLCLPPPLPASLDRHPTKALQRALLLPRSPDKLWQPSPLSKKSTQGSVPLLLTSLFPSSPASKQASSPLYWQHLCFVMLPSTACPPLAAHVGPSGQQHPSGLTAAVLGYPKESASQQHCHNMKLCTGFWEAFISFSMGISSFHHTSDVTRHSRRVERTGLSTSITPKQKKTKEEKYTPVILSHQAE